MEKLMSQEKKDRFKQQLDHQLMQKSVLRKDEKEEDRRYYEYIVSKGQELREKEEKEKFKKFLMSKEMEEQNRRIMESHTEQRLPELGKIYALDIGVKS
jgi:hypothetical protein